MSLNWKGIFNEEAVFRIVFPGKVLFYSLSQKVGRTYFNNSFKWPVFSQCFLSTRFIPVRYFLVIPSFRKDNHTHIYGQVFILLISEVNDLFLYL